MIPEIKKLSKAFSVMHEQLAIVRSIVEHFDDPVAREFVEKMEFGLLAPMRRLRVHFEIPYDIDKPKKD